jgi:HEAT repeat protein
MKKGMFSLLLVVVLAGFSLAADNTDTLSAAKLANAVDNYKLALKSNNPGVRSSALYMLALIKSRFPETNVSEVKAELGKISRKDEDALVRVHANLILSYLNSDSLLSKIKIENPEKPLAFYSQLIEEMTMSPEEVK